MTQKYLIEILVIIQAVQLLALVLLARELDQVKKDTTTIGKMMIAFIRKE